MKNLIKNNINLVRDKMAKAQIAACILPTADPHLSEYLVDHWKTREWCSGFTGSAGTLVITQNEAGLWTDSRYFTQASYQLEGTSILLHKEGLPATPSIQEFITSKVRPNDKVGADLQLFSIQHINTLTSTFKKSGITLVHFDPAQAWEDRPALPLQPISLFDEPFRGKETKQKLIEIREQMKLKECDTLITTSLEDIAWTLNLRGEDLRCTPVFFSHLIIGLSEVSLFVDSKKLKPEVASYLKDIRVKLFPYEEFTLALTQLDPAKILVDPKTTSYQYLSYLPNKVQIVFANSPIPLLKSIKNSNEIQSIQRAMQKDGVAMVRFLMWLEEKIEKKEFPTELDIVNQLYFLRKQQQNFKTVSFETIAGYKENGAIVHYTPTEESSKRISPNSFLLVDSGAQYLDGTTDLTRTIALGALTEEEKRDYTLVLKGHIALANAKFPAGTRGSQLDVLARLPLWNEGLNFLHGTGHGVGHYLNVHEGPQSIRMNENPITMEVGMLTSNEPGIYKEGKHGVRIENLMLVAPYKQGLFGPYYQFETVTLCPICTKGIITELMSSEEISWLNKYHEKVYKQLEPLLATPTEKAWLKEATKKINV